MLKVLIVDDDINVLKCLGSLLPWNELGYEVVGSCFDGAEAYETALRENPDVIITDIKMPVMDGTEFCRKIREDLCGVYIIFLSGYQSFETAQIALQYKVDAYILKPITREKLDTIQGQLINISKHNQNSNFMQAMLYDREMEEEVKKRLREYDFSWFEQFFQNVLQWSVGNLSLIKTFCSKMMEILFDYWKEIGLIDYAGCCKKALKLIEEKKIKNELIGYVRERYFDVLQFENVKKDQYYENLMEEIKKYIEDSFGKQDFSLSQIADRFSFSSDYLGKIFYKYMGITLGQYIIDYRMGEAVRLLTETRLTVAEIGVSVGYGDANYFTKIFKKKYGITPREYRRIIQLRAGGLDEK